MTIRKLGALLEGYLSIVLYLVKKTDRMCCRKGDAGFG